MTLFTYKDFEGNEVQFTESNSSFSGYAIKREYNKPSAIQEFLDGDLVGTITFRPTKTPVIFSVLYGCYREERYSHGGISARYVVGSDKKISGEYQRYDSTGVIQEVRYWFNGNEVTDDIKKYINFTGTDEDFLSYKFGDDERFNLWMQYGANFKFVQEYGYDVNKFDDIVKYCLK